MKAETTMIRLDKETRRRLKELVKPATMAGFLRELSLRKSTVSEELAVLRQGALVRSKLQLQVIQKMDGDLKEAFATIDRSHKVMASNIDRLLSRVKTDEETLAQLLSLPAIIFDLSKRLKDLEEK